MDAVAWSALGAYVVSAAGYAVSLWIRRVSAAKAATWVLLGAFLLQTFAVGGSWMQTGYAPVASVYETCGLLAWVLTGVYLALQLRTKTRVLGCLVAPAAALLLVFSSLRFGAAAALPAVLQGGLVSAHVVLSIAGEALFVLASLAGAMYLLQDRRIRRRRFTRFSRFLPSLGDLDRINRLGILWGFPLLTLGTLAGALWARTVWGSPWQWDPKQVWTLLAWAAMAFVLHQRFAIGWRGRRIAWASLLALGFLLAALLVERSFFATVHTFV